MSIDLSITASATQVIQEIGKIPDALARALAPVMKQFDDLRVKATTATSGISQGFTGASSPINAFERVVTQSLEHITQATRSTAQATTVMGQQMLSGFETAGKSVGDSTKKMTTGLNDVIGAIASVYAAFRASSAISEWITQVALTAARTEVLGTVLVQVARTANLSALAAQTYVTQIKAMGITTQEASSIVTRFIQNQLDLTKATQLARVAQDAAVISGQNSSEALAGLLHAITTLQPEIFRTYGLTVNLEQSYKTFAQQTGKTVESLSLQDKQTIALNATLTQGKAIAGVYAASMGDVGKQITSLPRLFEEASNAAGKSFLPALLAGVGILGDLLLGFTNLAPGAQITIGALAAAGAAVVTLSGIVAAGTIAWGAFGAAITAVFSLPVVLAIAAAAALTAGYVALTAAVDRQTEATRNQLKEMSPTERLFASLTGPTATLVTTFNALAKQTTLTTEQQVFMDSAMAELNRRFPTLEGSAAKLNAQFAEGPAKISAYQSSLETLTTSSAWKRIVDMMRGSQLAPGTPVGNLITPPVPAVAPAQFSGEDVGGALSSSDLAKFVADAKKQIDAFKQAESSFDPGKLTAKISTFNAAIQDLTKGRPGFTRPQLLEAYGIPNEAAATAELMKLRDAVTTTQNELAGRTSARINLATQGAIDAAKLQEQLLVQTQQKELLNLQSTQQARKVALEQEYQQAIASTVLTGESKLALETDFGRRRIAETQLELVERTTLEQTQITQMRDAKLKELNAEIARQQDLTSLGGTDAQAAVEQIKVLEGQKTIVRQEAATKNLGLINQVGKGEADTAKATTEITKKELTEQFALREKNAVAEAALRAKSLQAEISLSDAKVALVQAQVDGGLLTTRQGLDQQVVLQQQRFEVQKTLYAAEAGEAARVAATRVQDTDAMIQELTSIQTGYNANLAALGVKNQTEQQQLLNKQTEDYRNFIRDVQRDISTGLYDFFKNGFKSIADLWRSMLDTMLHVLADFGAQLLTKQLVIPIVASITGTAASALGGGASGGGSGGLTGMLEQILGIGSTASTGVSVITKLTDALGLTDSASGVSFLGKIGDMLGLNISKSFSFTDLFSTITDGFKLLGDGLASGIDGLIGTTFASFTPEQLAGIALEEGFTGAMAPAAGSVPLGTGASALAPVAAGLLGMGAGIYAAINANNDVAKAAYAASAAASAAAATSAILVSAGVIGATSGWTGIGAIVAAVTAAIGLILDQVISPAGPSLGIQLGTGLSVSTQDNQLQLGGDLSSTVTRHENLPADQSGITTSLESAVTGMVDVMVQSINAVAVDAPALLGPVQDALNTGLHDAMSINSGSFDHMKTDVEAFLQFIPLQVATQFLDPLMQAFAQVEDLGLQEKIMKLPQAAGQLAGVFFGLQQALDKLTDTPNTDVLRRISDIQTPLNEFFDAIFRQVDNLTRDIFSQLDASPLDQQLKLLPQAIASVSAVIQTFTDGLNAMSGQTYGDRDHLRVEIEELRKQLSDAAVQTADDIVQGVFAQTAVTLPKLLNESIEVEFLTISSFFTQQIQALQTLKFAQVQLGAVQAHPEDLSAQINALVKAILDNATIIVEDAFAEGSGKFTETLAIIQSIPDAVASLNPAFMQMKFLAAAFAPVANSFSTAIDGLQKELDPASVDLEKATERVTSLGDSLRENNLNIAVALPLFEALRVAVLAQLEAQIAAVQAEHQAKIDAINEEIALVQDQIDAINELADAQLEAIADQREAITVQQDAVQAQIDYTNEVVDATLDAIDVQRDAINVARDAVQAQRDVVAAQREVIADQREVVAAQQDAAQAQVNSITEVVNTLTSQLNALHSMQTEINQTIRPTESPVAQRADLEAQIAAQTATIPTLTGQEQIDAMDELVTLNQELLKLGMDTHQLDVQQEAANNLQMLSDYAAQLEETTGAQLTDAQQQLDVSQQQLDVLNAQLADLDAQLKAYDEQLEFYDDQLEAYDKQLEALDAQTQAVIDARDALLVPLNAEMDALNEQIEALDAQTKAINDQTEALLTPLNAQMDVLNAQLKEAQDTKELDRQIAVLQQEALAELKRMQESLQNLFLYGQIDSVTQGSSLNELLHIGKNTDPLLTAPLPVAVMLAAPLPVAVTSVPPPTSAAPPSATGGTPQGFDPTGNTDPLAVYLGSLVARGGLIGYAGGGMVPTMLEPREGYFLPPMTQAQQGALMGMNAAFPRFGFGGVVPGLGSGDTVPALMPPGTVIMNRRAMSAMGYQQGGVSNWFSNGTGSRTSSGLNSGGSSTSGGQQSVSSSTTEGDVHVRIDHITMQTNGTPQDLREQARLLVRHIKTELEELYLREHRGNPGSRRLYP